MCHINVTAVILQEISQFVVNINTLGRENFVKVESVGVFVLGERLGFGSWAGAPGCVRRQSCLNPNRLLSVAGAEGWARRGPRAPARAQEELAVRWGSPARPVSDRTLHPGPGQPSGKHRPWLRRTVVPGLAPRSVAALELAHSAQGEQSHGPTVPAHLCSGSLRCLPSVPAGSGLGGWELPSRSRGLVCTQPSVGEPKAKTLWVGRCLCWAPLTLLHGEGDGGKMHVGREE